MSHNINEGRIFYHGQKPWHGIGTELDRPATSKEAITLARLGYEVELQPIFLKDGTQVPDRQASVRKDNNNVLGVVGNRYTVMQNVDAFNFFDNVVAEKLAMYHTAGALGKGERIWILAKLPKDMIIGKEDKVEEYLLLTNSHDGSTALQMYFTPIRVVCQNTLIASTRNKGQSIAIRHTTNMGSKVAEARRALGIAIDFYKELEEEFGNLANFSLKTQQVESYFDAVLKIKDGDKETSTRKKNEKDTLLGLFERGKGNDNPNIRHSAWCAYNAVAEYTDHYRTVKNSTENPSNRLKSIWLGSSARMKDRAYSEIKKLVKS